MSGRTRFLVGLLVSAGGCAQIIDADGPYVLVENSSQGGGGHGGVSGMGAGGSGGAECTKNDDCLVNSAPCKINECLDGSCVENDAAAGTPCAVGGGIVCNGLGACVECTLPEHCVNLVETQCIKRACIENVCQLNYLGQETPAGPAMQEPGDCKIVVCDGIGGTKTINDNNDTPNDDNGCTTDTCLNGSKVHTKVPTGTNCGVNSFCNSQGQCVGCLKPPDCAGNFDFCKSRTCMAGICGVNYEADGTPVPSGEQTAQDCYIVVCDGSGNKVTRVDMNDGVDDGNPCTRDACNPDAVPTHDPEMAGTPCAVGDNDVCDGLGDCKKSNGKPCVANNECVGNVCTDGVCCESACNTSCSTCNLSPLTAGTCSLVPMGQSDTNASLPCVGNSACDGNGTCRKNDGQTCATADECVHGFCVDGYCCESPCTATCKSCGRVGYLGKCVNIPVGGTDNAASLVCNGTQACDGIGGCKLAQGQTCSSGSQCAGGNCHPGQHVCQ